jgi:hypothetical protein
MKNLMLLVILIISSCSNHNVSNYQNEMPKLNLHEFFNGKIYAQGVVQDRSGKVIKRFDVDMDASWTGNICTLDEKFNYADKTKSSRIWKLKEIDPFKYEGQASDVRGIAHGEVAGNTFYFQYNLDLAVGDSHYDVHFEDWMFLLDKKTLLARSYMTKWGFKVGEVTIVMNKMDK